MHCRFIFRSGFYSSIFHKIKQRYLIIGFTVLSTVLTMMVPISQYETFLLLIGAVFVPLFGVVISDYYIVKDRHYETTLMYGSNALSIGFPAIYAWSVGVLLYYVLSSISQVYIPQ
jgi:nucleobase:cation symporter-1, NCS1 family